MSRSPTPLYREFSSIIQAIENCRGRGSYVDHVGFVRDASAQEWLEKHETNLKKLIDYLPSGSGIDNGVTLDSDESHAERLVFHFSYHNMNEDGYYGGWDDYTMIVTPSLLYGLSIDIVGPCDGDPLSLLDNFHDLMNHHLSSKVWQTEDCNWHSGLYETQPAV